MTKRRSPGQGHIRKIKLPSGKPAYRGWLTVGYRLNAKGERVAIKRTAQARTRAEVEAKLDRIRQRYKLGADFSAEKMRLSTLFDRAITFQLETGEISPNTALAYRWAGRRVGADLGDPLIVELAHLTLQDCVFRLAPELTRSSLNSIVAALTTVFGQARLWRLMTENIAEGLKVPAKTAVSKRKPGRALDVAEAARFVAALDGERLGLAALISLVYGLRRGEVAGISRDSIDLERMTLTIDAQHQVVDGKVRPQDTKTRDRRVFPLHSWLAPLVAQQFARNANERRAMGAQWSEPDEGLLFVRETDGGRISGQQVYALVRRTAKRAELGHVAPHDLRRTLVSLMGRAGIDRDVRAAIAGHRDPETTDRYRVLFEGEAGDALASMNRLLGLDQTPTGEGDDAN